MIGRKRSSFLYDHVSEANAQRSETERALGFAQDLLLPETLFT